MAVRAELMAQGARPALVDRLTKMVDVNDVDIDDEDGSIDVTEAVMGIKKDMPEMFGPRKATPTRKRKESGAGEGGSGSCAGTGTGKSAARTARGSGRGAEGARDRESVVAGKSVSVRVDPGGRRRRNKQ